MKNLLASLITAASIATLSVGGTALAEGDEYSSRDGSTKAQTPVIVERNDKGKATKVRVNGKVYDVCMNDEHDGCINPRAAGLDWGNRPLDYWPGKPASQM